jgi:hypothetical protein
MMTLTYEKIFSTTLTSTTSSYTFSSIPNTYTDLVIVASVRKSGENGEAMFVTFNGDNGSNYSYTWLTNLGAYSYRVTSDLRIQVYSQTTASSTFNANILNVNNYGNSTTYKTLLGRDSTGSLNTSFIAGLWRNTNAITSITLTPDFYLSPTWQIGSSFALYGIKAE